MMLLAGMAVLLPGGGTGLVSAGGTDYSEGFYLVGPGEVGTVTVQYNSEIVTSRRAYELDISTAGSIHLIATSRYVADSRPPLQLPQAHSYRIDVFRDGTWIDGLVGTEAHTKDRTYTEPGEYEFAFTGQRGIWRMHVDLDELP